MLTAFHARSPKGDLLNFPLEDSESGFIVADIDGLGPVKANLVSSSFAGRDGEQYQSSRREARNLKFKLELDPDPEVETVWDLRKRLYKVFMTEAQVKITFALVNGLNVDIEGVVESCDPDIFSQEPAMDISVMCFEPDLIDPVPVTVAGTTTADETNTTIEYEGTVETGIKLVLNVDRALPEFTVYHTLPSDVIQTLQFDNFPLEAGDVLTISTVFGSKGATLVRAGVTSSVLYGVSPQSKFIELMEGTNNIRVYAEGLPVPYTIEYITRYGGL
ncbi:minor tail protein [Streptomyces phage RosaAsantewaa]|nr:minor tail protein [Streptomyces phage RosaAsantewaa]